MFYFGYLNGKILSNGYLQDHFKLVQNPLLYVFLSYRKLFVGGLSWETSDSTYALFFVFFVQNNNKYNNNHVKGRKEKSEMDQFC